MRTQESNSVRRYSCFGLVTALVLVASGCGGGGGGNGGGGGQVATPTPTLGRNSNSVSNTNGSTTIAFDSFELIANGGDASRTGFRLFLRTSSGAPVGNALVTFSAGAGLVVLSPESGSARTDSTGTIQGEVQGVFGGSFQIQAVPAAETGLPPVTFNLQVFGQSQGPTVTPTGGGDVTPPPTVTPTAVPVDDVVSLIVQAQPFRISSAVGGELTVSILAFDANNIGLRGVRLLLDANPRSGVSFDPITPITNSNGIATSTMRIEPGAEVGALTITASAGPVTGSIAIQIVSGASERPVSTVVLETDQPIIGTDSGGTASLKARVFDVDNIGIPNVNVLFTTEIGQVSPPVEVSCGGDANPCPPTETGLAQTTLSVPPGAVIREYGLTALAGGVTGSASISVVTGRGGTGTGNPNAAAGEPASITLGASPTSIFVSGVGAVEQSTIIVRVFDNNNNPLSGRVVAVRVVSDEADGPRMLPLSGATAPPPPTCLEDPARQQAFDDGRLVVGISDRAGFVLASMQAGAIKGTVTVEACAASESVLGGTVAVVARQPVVTVAAGPPALVTLAMNNVFIDNNDGTLTTTVAALVKDANGNTVEDNTAVSFVITNRQDVSIVGGSTTNNLPNCEISQFPAQTGLPITPQPGTAVTCITYPAAQAGTVVGIRAVSNGVSNEDNDIDDEEFNMPPGATTGPATGIPSARSFSLASEFLNLSGRLTFGLDSTITAFVGDRFGNPVSRNTLVRFTTDGGGITSQNVTDLIGRAEASLFTQAPIPSDGTVVVTASVQGEEDFRDLNGNGVFDPGIDVFDPILHDQDGNGVWSANTTIHAQIVVIFSGRTQILVEPGSFSLNPGEVQCFGVLVSDDLGNPIVGGSTITVEVTDTLTLLGPPAVVVPDSSRSCTAGSGACFFQFCVFSADPVTVVTTAAVTFVVTSTELGGGGNGSVAATAVGVIQPPAPPAEPEE